MVHKLLAITLALIILLTIPIGCTVGSAPLDEPVTIKVIATSDFGSEPIFVREVEIDKRLTAQAVLAKATEIKMDGSYIVEFEGLRGNDQVYWLYYINGFMAKVFASGYNIRPGDVMHWDFHDWAGAHHGSSAIIGSFPEPLLHGYEGKTRPTIVVYEESFQTEAQTIKTKLRELGVNEVSMKIDSALSKQEKGDSNLVILGTMACDLIAELNKEHDPLGMYVSFEDGKMKVHNYKFRQQREYGVGAGVIQATQNLWNRLGTGACQNVVFMVSGVDEAGVQGAAKVLIDSADDILAGRSFAFENAFGVVIFDGEIIKTPL